MTNRRVKNLYLWLFFDVVHTKDHNRNSPLAIFFSVLFVTITSSLILFTDVKQRCICQCLIKKYLTLSDIVDLNCHRGLYSFD